MVDGFTPQITTNTMIQDILFFQKVNIPAHHGVKPQFWIWVTVDWVEILEKIFGKDLLILL